MAIRHMNWHCLAYRLLPGIACFVFIFSFLYVQPVSSVVYAQQGSESGQLTPARDISSSDSYVLTIQSWLNLEHTALDTQKVLQEIHTQAVTAVSDDLSSQRAYFSQKLSDKYPGSTYNGMMGAVMLPDKMMAHFNDKFEIDRIESLGKINTNYFIKKNQFVCSNGTNSVGGTVNKANPSQSLFTKVDIASMKVPADKIVGSGTVENSGSVEAVINDAYQQLSLKTTERMDSYAERLIASADVQKEALRIAENGYRSRHLQDYQQASARNSQSKADSADLSLPSERRATKTWLLRAGVILLLFILCGLAINLIWRFMGFGFMSLTSVFKKDKRRRSLSGKSRSGGSSGSHKPDSSRSRSSSRSHRSRS